MADTIDVPLTSHDVDPSQPVDSLKSIAFGVIGFMLMFLMLFGGRRLFETATDQVGENTGDLNLPVVN